MDGTLTSTKNGLTADPLFVAALESQKIKNQEEPHLKKMLALIMIRVGLKGDNLPSDSETAALLDFMLKHYSGHGCDEIVLAFDMALARRLDLEEKEIPCYQNFSCEYFARIMNAYRRWAVQEFKQLEGKLPLAMLEGPKEDMSDIAMQEWLNDTILSVQAGQRAIEFLPLQLYDWLVSRGEILVGPAEKWDYMRKAVHRRQAFLVYMDTKNTTVETREQLSAFMAMKKSGCYQGAEINNLKVLAKKIVLWEQITGKAYEIPTDEESNG